MIVTDTSPLITLSLADHLHVLAMPRIRIIVPDALFVEATRVEGAPGASRLVEWAASHDALVSIRPTETGVDQIERLRTGRSIRGMGETAALEVLEDTSKRHPERGLFLLFEDRDLAKRSIILPPGCFAVATGDWLRVLERTGLIQSADHVLDLAAAEGRTVERQRRQTSGDAAIAAAETLIDRSASDKR